MPIIFRPHKGGLDESMSEAKEFANVDELLNWICEQHNCSVPWFKITPKELYIEKQNFGDARVGWNNMFFVFFERPSKIKNIRGYKKYFGLDEKDFKKRLILNRPVGVIGMFATDYNNQ